MKCKLFVSAIAILLMAGMANAAVVTVDGVTGHNGGNWGPWHGHLSDALNGNLTNDFGTGADHLPGMDTSADPNDPSTWIYTHAQGWKNEWTADGRLDGAGDPGNGIPAAINNKIGYMVLDLGSEVANLDNIYLWGLRDGGKVTQAVKDFNLYYASGVGIDALAAMPQSKGWAGGSKANADYDFSSGDWTQIGSTRTLALSSAPWGPQDTAALGGISAQYIGIEILSAHGDHKRVGLAQVEVTQIPEPASLALLALGGLMMIRRRRA